MKNTNSIKTAICVVGLLLSQLMVSAQSEELAMATTPPATTESYTPAIINTTGPERLSYEIIDKSGNNIAAGQLNRNSSLAVNVSMGTYTLRVNGTPTRTVTVSENDAVSPISTGTAASAYIIVKMDSNGAFSYNKMLF